jgi:hypothetical protein
MEPLRTLVQVSSPEDKWKEREIRHTQMGVRGQLTLWPGKRDQTALHQDLWYVELNLINWQPHEIYGTGSLLTS